MRKRLVRKVFDMIDDIAARENKEVRHRLGGWLGADEHAWPDLDFPDWNQTLLMEIQPGDYALVDGVLLT